MAARGQNHLTINRRYAGQSGRSEACPCYALTLAIGDGINKSTGFEGVITKDPLTLSANDRNGLFAPTRATVGAIRIGMMDLVGHLS